MDKLVQESFSVFKKVSTKVRNLVPEFQQSWTPNPGKSSSDGQLSIVPKPPSLASSRIEVSTALDQIWPELCWTSFEPKNPRLVGAKKSLLIGKPTDQPQVGTSQQCELSLLYVAPDLGLPQFGEEADSWYYIISGSSDAKIGPIQEMVTAVKTGQYLTFLSAAPKVFESGKQEPLVLLVLRFGLLDGPRWFADPAAGNNYSNDIMKIDNIHEYYLNFVSDYEEVMRGWGYCIPEVTAGFIVNHAQLDQDPKDAQVLDLGCGDGLTGKALLDRGFKDIVGVDFSEPMLKKAEARGCYKEVKQVDLLKALPFEAAAFDLLVSTGVTTYLKPEVLRHWLKVTRTGGKIVFSHKTLLWDEWEKEHESMETEGLWNKIWILDDPIPYLPSLKEDGENHCRELTKIYIYEKL